MTQTKPITGYETQYSISSNGEVYSHTRNKYLKQEDCKRNSTTYKRVSLSKDGKVTRFQTHRLVAEHFVLNPDNKPHVNHLDNNGSNNNHENLEWCTHSENMIHAQKQGRLCKSQSKAGKASGEKSRLAKKTRYENSVNNIYGYWKILELITLEPKARGICVCTKCNVTTQNMLLNPILTGSTTQCSSCSGRDWHKQAGHTQDYLKEKPKRNKPVAQYSIDGSLIKTYKTISEAELELGVKPGSSKIGQVCKGKANSYRNFKWNYL